MRNTKEIFSNAQIGDIVYRLLPSGFAEGMVTDIVLDDEYPIKIKFNTPDESIYSYNYDGRPQFLHYDVGIFWKKFDIPIKEKKKVKKTVTGYGIYDTKENRFLSQIYKDKEAVEEANRQQYRGDDYIVAKAKIKYEIEE